MDIPVPVLIALGILAVVIVVLISTASKDYEACEECGEKLHFWDTKRSECRNVRCSMYKKRV